MLNLCLYVHIAPHCYNVTTVILCTFFPDSTCLKWGEVCGELTNCQLYDTDQLRKLMSWVTSAAIFVSTLCDMFVWRHVGDLKLYDEEDTNNQDFIGLERKSVELKCEEQWSWCNYKCNRFWKVCNILNISDWWWLYSMTQHLSEADKYLSQPEKYLTNTDTDKLQHKRHRPSASEEKLSLHWGQPSSPASSTSQPLFRWPCNVKE